MAISRTCPPIYEGIAKRLNPCAGHEVADAGTLTQRESHPIRMVDKMSLNNYDHDGRWLPPHHVSSTEGAPGIPLPGFLEQANLHGFRPFASLTDIDHDLLVLHETNQSRPFQHRDMDENIPLPVDPVMPVAELERLR
jgi:hypothetical protein